MLRKNKYINRRKFIFKIISISILIIGLLMLIVKKGYKYYLHIKEINKVNEYFEFHKINTLNLKINKSDIASGKVSDCTYLGVLEIPQINLLRVFFRIDDQNNDSSKNLEVIKESDMPDVTGGNLIIAAHSGDSSVSHFKNLYKLEKDDIAYIYYNNEKYIYRVFKKYEVMKTGTISIDRDNSKNILTLITCDRTDKMKQIIYQLELTDKN